MKLRRAVAVLFLGGMITAGYATYSRVISMGNNSGFFMDDISVFRNPANVNVYPNLLMGDLGVYQEVDSLDYPESEDTDYEALQRNNRDPLRPFFGAILSYSLNQSTDAGAQYPLFSIGAAFNRYDPLLDYIDTTTDAFKEVVREDTTYEYNFAAPVGKVDVMTGFAFPNGGMVGVGTYLAFQKVRDGDNATIDPETRLYKGNVGINWPIAKVIDLEVSSNVSYLSGIGSVFRPDSADTIRSTVADGNVSFDFDARLFSALTNLNGDFVPRVGVSFLNLEDVQVISGAAGLGINLNIDRGFFWAGAEGLFANRTDDLTSVGGRVSFGIERNVVWDWLVARTGGRKTILYTSDGKGSSYQENPEATGMPGDLLSVGWGVNIENRLRFDFVMAEDIAYTFTNLVTGNHHHLWTRISVTYSF